MKALRLHVPQVGGVGGGKFRKVAMLTSVASGRETGSVHRLLLFVTSPIVCNPKVMTISFQSNQCRVSPYRGASVTCELLNRHRRSASWLRHTSPHLSLHALFRHRVLGKLCPQSRNPATWERKPRLTSAGSTPPTGFEPVALHECSS